MTSLDPLNLKPTLASVTGLSVLPIKIVFHYLGAHYNGQRVRLLLARLKSSRAVLWQVWLCKSPVQQQMHLLHVPTGIIKRSPAALASIAIVYGEKAKLCAFISGGLECSFLARVDETSFGTSTIQQTLGAVILDREIKLFRLDPKETKVVATLKMTWMLAEADCGSLQPKRS